MPISRPRDKYRSGFLPVAAANSLPQRKRNSEITAKALSAAISKPNAVVVEVTVEAAAEVAEEAADEVTEDVTEDVTDEVTTEVIEVIAEVTVEVTEVTAEVTEVTEEVTEEITAVIDVTDVTDAILLTAVVTVEIILYSLIVITHAMIPVQ